MTKENGAIKAGWNFDNSYSHMPELFYTSLNPTPVHSPSLVKLNHPLATFLGLNPQALQSNGSVEIFSGNQLPDGASPLAQAYAGHQFGHFTMLGDGRALLLGEQVTPLGQRVDIQLKGSGKTPYSRSGDGRATLGPMLREYIISEAMHGLGIATTRSLAVVTTGEPVLRETEQPGAVLTRVASSHLRVGTFQYAARWGTVEDLRALADYALHRHFPGHEGAGNRYLFLLKQVISQQADLIAKWQLIGFIHGVMNTDNMTISGETIDYGPCAFMDAYDPATVFSSIDIHGRYAYGNQPDIAAWNLARFAEALLPLLHSNREKAIKSAQDAVMDFPELFHRNWLAGMRAKLGIFNEEQEDEELVSDILEMMLRHQADYTNTFRALTLARQGNMELSKADGFAGWYEQWRDRLERQKEAKASSRQLMQSSNPSVIPRNHQVEAALEAAVNYGDYSIMEKLLDVLEKPYEYSPEQEEYSILPEQSGIQYRTFCGT